MKGKNKGYITVVKNQKMREQVVNLKINKGHRHHQTAGANPLNVEQVDNLDKWKFYIILPIILLITLIIYNNSLKNGFVWDDIKYIINNDKIKDLSLEGIKAMFTNFSSGSYAPLTDLINAIQYRISGLNPEVFHTGSLVFHCVNVVLVFWFIKLLSRRWDIAAISALFFGIHPLQVESVAWISGGSNLFCATFFLISCIAYLYYLQHNQKRYLFVSFFFFLFSILSKPVTVFLPIVLILIDYFKDRKNIINSLLEKSPFLFVSIGAGILSLLLKNQAGSMHLAVFSFPQRIIFASYGFMKYLGKIFFPLNLSAFYPYPVKNADVVPTEYFVYVLLLLGLIILAFYSLRYTKKVFFGLGFFTINIFLLLQLLPVGGAIMADRYSYIPSIGIFYLAGEGLTLIWNKKAKLITIITLCVFIVFFSVKTYARCSVWKNDMSLWNNVINQYKTVPVAYFNRGSDYMNEKKYNQALEDFNKAIELNPNYTDAYVNRGNVFQNLHEYERALADYNNVVALNPNYYDVYVNRAIIFMNLKKYDRALEDYNKAIELNPSFNDLYINRGNILSSEKRYEEAIIDYTKAIDLKADDVRAYNNRGIVFMNLKKYDKALMDYNKIIELDPNYSDAYINRGNIFSYEKRYAEAIYNYSKVIELKANDPRAYYNRGLAEYYSGNKNAAYSDLKQAENLGYKLATEALMQIKK